MSSKKINKMESSSKNIEIKPQTLLASLWIFTTLNYLYCDLIGLMDSNLLKQYLTGNIDGLVLNQEFLLLAAILMEIPIAMTLLSCILKYKANRLANIIAGSIKTLAMILTLFMGPFTIYYLFFAVIEIGTTIYIVWYAWRWKNNSL